MESEFGHQGNPQRDSAFNGRALERLVRSQRQRYLDGWLHEVSAALHIETIALMVGSLTDADVPTGFNAMKADAGRATLDNILEVSGRLALRNRGIALSSFKISGQPHQSDSLLRILSID
ncbi:hypothetical protein [Brucella intermedia]|uniref:hypothetical protein n=1 Tax=Brucella intermedia TaxID=94625 RepID=UPI00046A6C01|nr:hypothetical protein [Brucella intermedia]